MQSWHSSRNKLPSSRMSNEAPLAAACLQVVDFCLLGVLFIAPLFFGGRHPLGRFVFVLLACVAGVAWAIHQLLVKQGKWTRSWANVLGFAAIASLVVQLLPLPAEWLEILAPRNTSLLRLWSKDTGATPHLGTWETLSLTPKSTNAALATLVAYLALFITAIGRLRERTDIERLIRNIALAAILMSGFGVLQYFTSNGLFFWFYEYPYANTTRTAKGSFTTCNHFAHFAILGIGPLLAWIALKSHYCDEESSHSKTKKPSFAAIPIGLHVGLAITVFAVLLSFSRGGAAVLAIASTLTIVIYYRNGIFSGTYLYGLVMIGLVIVGMLSLSGYEKVAQRLDDFSSGSLEELDVEEGRRKIWRANVKATLDGSFFGAGAGSHREIYPIYLTESSNKEYTHAESGYLQVATENGFFGAALLTLVVLMILSWCWQALRNANSKGDLALAGAATASLAASLIHSIADFVWYIPSCMSFTILLAACALRLAQLATYPPTATQRSVSCSWSKTRWICFSTMATCAAIWAIIITYGPATASLHWDKYLLSSAANKKISQSRLTAIQPPSEDPSEQQSRTQAMIFHLRNTLAYDPHFQHANLRLAGKYLQLFSQRQRVSDNAMSINQIRDAALASQFPSAKALQQWLLQAFGKNSHLLYRAHYHAKEALKHCPLQGEGYLYLADLCFLEGHNPDAIDAYVTQSLKVRPYDGDVLFEAGRQRLLMGQVDEAFAHWQQIYRDTGTHQLKIVQLLAGHIPAETFIQLFEPDWKTLQLVWNRYQIANNTLELQILLRHAENEAKQAHDSLPPTEAASIWFKLAKMQTQLQFHESSLNSTQTAYRLTPNAYSIRRSLANKLLKAERYKQSEPHLRWCLARRPNDATLQNQLIQATKSRLPSTAIKTIKSSHQ